MTWQLWTSLAVIFFSFSLITANYLRQHISSIQIMFWQYFGSLSIVIILALILKIPSPFTLPTFYFAVLIGSIYSFGATALTKALGYNLAKTTILFSFRNHISIFLFTIFMSEYLIFNPQIPAGRLKLIALVLATLSIILLITKQSKTKSNKSWKAPAIIAFIIFGLGGFFAKILVQNILPAQAVLGQYLGSFIGINLLSFFRKTRLLFTPKYILFNLFRGLLVGIGWFAVYTALTTGPGSLVAIIQALGVPIISVSFGLILLKEHQHMTKKNYLGLLLAILSIILLIK